MAPHVFIFLALISATTAVRNHGKEFGSIDSQKPLLYNHLPKAGGNFVKNVLNEVID
jgi:hypothetical protein